MKRFFLPLLVAAICLWGGLMPARAYTLPFALPNGMLSFGAATPSVNGGGGSLGDSTTNTGSGNNGNNSGGSSESQNSNKNTVSGSGNNTGALSAETSSTGTTPDNDMQPGGTIVNNYEPNAYGPELSQEQQVLDDAQTQYGGPRLSSLSVNGLALIPVFGSETFSYSVYVPEEQSSVQVYALAASGLVYIDGAAGNSRQIAVGSGEKTVRIIVTGQNSSTAYTISLLRDPQLLEHLVAATPTDIPLLTHVQLDNGDFFYEQDITTSGGDIFITLPQASNKKFNITLSANIEVLTYCNNIRVYNVVYNTQAGAWQWKRQNIEMRTPETRLEILLADKRSLALQNNYTLILQQPPDLVIQMQVGNDQALVGSALHMLEAPPLIREGHTMVPLRFIAEALGAAVSWHSEEKRVELLWQGKTLELFIGKLSEGMPQAPFIDNGRTMVPLRYVSERLNCQVEWLATTREIVITR